MKVFTIILLNFLFINICCKQKISPDKKDDFKLTTPKLKKYFDEMGITENYTIKDRETLLEIVKLIVEGNEDPKSLNSQSNTLLTYTTQILCDDISLPIKIFELKKHINTEAIQKAAKIIFKGIINKKIPISIDEVISLTNKHKRETLVEKNKKYQEIYSEEYKDQNDNELDEDNNNKKNIKTDM